ncbi:dihydropteroate synthase [Limnoraphis robusta]|uniref:Dihydropteroate synthase n=1 Tax=Limnoraphis robusta CS-951 TaxID=1637645 RepID=A0A0F5YDE9_9CYAN|nr:dihydropteroate synthase [Limnoraphis robusta]KKD36906.1 dihydropteroate synthase [Limnoraphis robusta CS-951]
MLTLADIYEIYDKHKDDYNAQVQELTIGNKKFNFNSQTAILGIVNLSVDSWFNHTICYTSEQAIRRGKVLTAQGADIIDIGTEATTKNTQRADEFQQKSQLVPILETFSKEGILTSVETYYPEVARICLKAGANVINFTGTENSEEMYRAVADFDAAIIICYLQGKNARDVGDFDFSLAKDPIDLVYDYFGKEIEKATKLGVRKIFIDPALGLGYTNFYYKYEYVSTRIGYQIRSLLSAFRLRKLGFPLFNQIPTALEVFGEEVRSAQVFTAVFAALGKSDLLRTHEVAKIKAVLETMSLV